MFTTNCCGFSKDSLNRFITLNFNKGNLETFEYNNNNDVQPFKNIKQYLFSVLFQNKVYSYKKINFNAYVGLKSSFTNIGSIDVQQNLKQINNNINSRSINLALNTGISIDIKVIKFKNSEFQLGAGILTNGSFYNSIKIDKYVFERNDFYQKDSIEIKYSKNNIFEINPFYQLTYKQKINKKQMIIGIRYFISSINGRPENIEYKFFSTRFPTTPMNYSGYFSSFKLPLICYLGLAF